VPPAPVDNVNIGDNFRFAIAEGCEPFVSFMKLSAMRLRYTYGFRREMEYVMRNLMMAAAAASLAVPTAMALPAPKATASVVTAAMGASASAAATQRRHKYREWRGRDGRRYCRKPDGTTGLVVGAVGGALVGRAIDTRGDRTLGTLGGAAAGALAGRAIERGGSNCR
jgi:uncharacterized protein YcfJ